VRRYALSLGLAIAVLLASWSTGVWAGETKEKPVIEQILDLLLQRGQITQEEYRTLQEKARQEQAAGAKEPSPGILAGIEKGKPFLKSADDNFRIELGGRLQADFAAAEDDTRLLTGPTLGSQFHIRRARVDVDVTFYKWIFAKIQSELSEGVSLKDAYLDLTFMPELRFRAGQFHVPFSLEEYGTSDNFIDFIERSLVNELAPARDRGVKLYGDLMGGVVSYHLGGFNGTGEDTSDNNGDKDLAFRVSFSPFRSSDSVWLKGLQLAGNVTWGNQDSSMSAQGRTIGRTINRFRFFAPQTTRGERLRYGGDLAWLIGPAALKFEYDVQTDERRGLGPGGVNLDDVTARGWYVSGTYVLTGEDKQRSGNVIPRRPFIPFSDQWGLGAFEVGFRYAELEFRSDDPVNFFDANLSRIPGEARPPQTAPSPSRSASTGISTNGPDSCSIGITTGMTTPLVHRLAVNWGHARPQRCAAPIKSRGKSSRVSRCGSKKEPCRRPAGGRRGLSCGPSPGLTSCFGETYAVVFGALKPGPMILDKSRGRTIHACLGGLHVILPTVIPNFM
jgi:phosphate-selective porin OprO and OprP